LFLFVSLIGLVKKIRPSGIVSRRPVVFLAMINLDNANQVRGSS